jgi:hypothetical protein
MDLTEPQTNQAAGSSTPTPQPRTKLALRAFTLVLLGLAGSVLAFSGVILFVAPVGRIANWTDWRLVGLTKREWIAIHHCFAALFLVAAVAHVILNWRPLLSYFKSRVTGRPGLRWAWLVAVVVCVGAWVCTRAGWPPASWLLTFNARIRRTWDDPRVAPPIPHAEELTIKELAKQAEVPLDTALQRLAQRGVRGVGPDVIVAELANQNRLSARRIYEIVTGQVGPGRGAGAGRGQRGQAGHSVGDTPRPEKRSTQASSPGNGLGRGGAGPGGGLGRMTLAEFCQSRNLDLKQVQARLEAKGLKGQPNRTLREIASANGLDHPRQIVDLIEGP